VKKDRKKLISPFAVLSVLLFIIIGAVYFATDLSAAFADRVNSTVSRAFRIFMAGIGDIFPFSLIELLILCLPIILFFVIRKAIRVFADREGRVRFIINIAAFVLLIYSGHLLALGIAHNTSPISEKMGLCETEVTKENLSETLVSLRDEINLIAEDMPRDESGLFDPGYSYDEISALVCDSYDALAEEYGLDRGFASRAKGVRFSFAMSYLGITGIYTYPTGEANVNTQYPAYVTIFTTAHEMSHQRGILRENEANFVAYLITTASGDDCLRYSGLLNMYGYFSSALYKTDKEAYYAINGELSPLARTDIRAANAVTEKYGDTIIEDISEWINNLYLNSSGTPDGTVSYSRVVHLVLAYENARK